MNSFYKAVAEINRGLLSLKTSVNVFPSNLVIVLLTLLLKQGFIQNFMMDENGKINVFYKYTGEKVLLRKLVIISKPSRRIYVTKDQLIKGYGSGDLYIISGPNGFFFYRQGLVPECGGEVILKML